MSADKPTPLTDRLRREFSETKMRPAQVFDHMEKLERALSDARAEGMRDAVSFADLEAAAAHIEQNGSNLRVKFGHEHEGRCRELCAMYLREFIVSQRMKQKLAILAAIEKEGKK